MPQVRQLQQAVGAAVAAGQVPAQLRTPLIDTTASLATSVKCPPKPKPPAPPKKKDDHGHHHPGHGDHGGDGQGGDGKD
jgi:hypothetical protein